MPRMKKLQGVVAGSFLSAALFLMPAPSDAMEIKQFNQMSIDDQAHYIEILMGESVKYLWRKGRKEDADAVLALFKRDSSGRISKGHNEFSAAIDGLAELERLEQLKKTPHVEQALAIVLKDHGVVIPMKDFMLFAQDFRPSSSGIEQQ